MDDKQYLDLALTEAEKSLNLGNYPVGAVLVIDDQVVGVGGNFGETSQNYINHAESHLLINHGPILLRAAKDGQNITLYSTLEPCLMCLGEAIMNKIDRIVYIQKDPRAGACGINKDSLGVRYQESWPEIVHNPYSSRSKELITQFLKKQIENGERVDWSTNFLKLLETC